MKLKIREIVLTEGRPFCLSELRELEMDGKKYQMSEGTARNYISKFKKSGEVQDAFPSNPKFYTIPGHKFDKKVTLNRMGVTSIIDDSLLRQTPIYKWLKYRPTEKQSLHSIRLTFVAKDIWSLFSNVYPQNIEPISKDIKLPPSTFFQYLDVNTTIHHTNTVSVAISCSFRPIVIGLPDFLQLYEALSRTEMQLGFIAEKHGHGSAATSLPSFRRWTVKLWHFGVDTIDEYTGKEFHVTFEEGMSDLYRIYTKRMRDGKKRIRGEHQQYQNQEFADAFVKQLFPDGLHLVEY